MPDTYSMYIVHKDRIVFEIRNLKNRLEEQDAIDQIVKLAKYNNKRECFTRLGYYMVNFG